MTYKSLCGGTFTLITSSQQMLSSRNSAGEEFKIKVFLSGDYEFLFTMYGLSGASGKNIEYVVEKFNLGRHNCLWCLIKGEDLITPAEVCGTLEKRTLEKNQT